MGVVDRTLNRLREEAETRLGVTVVEKQELEVLQENRRKFEAFAEEASELAYWSLDYFSGKPQQMRPERRKRLAQRSRIALTQDPLAGAEADLLANFGFGRGVATPDAEDEDVQKIIDEAWKDPVNEQKLTGFEAQRHRSNELLTQANLFPVAFVRNGRVRLGFLDADRVRDVICDPDDEERPLWYVYEEHPKARWDFDADRYLMPGEGERANGNGDGAGTWGGPKLTYYPHWRNVEDVRREREENGEEPLEEPPEEKLGQGLVEHIRINRIGRTEFGTPPWARTLRYFSAMNELTEAHVSMAQAASTWIAKRVLKGTPETIARSANAILSQTGELGAARFGLGDEDVGGFPARSGQIPPSPGSLWTENESHKLEALSLSSGAAQAAQTAQIVRAPIAAASQFGQHYLGDASNANLATATSLELPTQMTVQAWQETFRQLLGWFVDLVIQSALRAGRLGGTEEKPRTEKTLSELSLREAEDAEEAERRTGKKLGYTLTMPFPGRRNLPEVQSFVTSMATTFDTSGQNIPLRRGLLLFAATHGMQLEDPTGWVDEVLPEETIDAIAKAAAQASAHAAAGAVGELPEQQLSMDEPVSATKGGDVPRRARGNFQEELEALGASTAGLFERDVIDPVLNGHHG